MSIDKRGKGVYRFRVMHKGNNYSTTFYGTEKEAKRAHNEFVLDVKKGKFLQASDMTLRELWDLYLESREIEAGTIRNYKQYQKSFDFLDMQVQEITKLFLKNYHNKHKRYANDNDYRVLKSIFSFGVEMDIISVNPMSFGFRRAEKKMFEEILSLEELKKFISGIINLENKRCRAFLLTQLCLGTRYGETAGILRENVDTVNHILHIKHQFKEIDGGMGIGKTKTRSSVRDIYILEFVRPYLYEIVFQTPSGGLVFQTSGNFPILLMTINKELERLCKSLGIPRITSHKLRKLSATMAVYSGVDPLSVSAMLGHTSLDMTEKYLLTMQERKVEEGQKVDEYLRGLSCICPKV